MKKTALVILGLAATTVFGAHDALAKDLGDSYWSAERFQVRGRVIGVLPNDGRGNVNIGGTSEAGDALTPEVDVT